MKLRINDTVWQDLSASINYYETESNQGERFNNDFYATLERIKENPYLYQVINNKNHRRGLFRHYKYSVFYRVNKQFQSIDILAIAGQSQKPQWMD